MKLRLKVKWLGAAWGVDLPTYSMVPQSFLPLIPGLVGRDGILPDADPLDPRLSAVSCVVNVPDSIVDERTGKVNIGLLHAIYYGQPKWGDSTYSPDI